MTVLYAGTPEPNELMNFTTTIGNFNSTHQDIRGTLEMKLPLTDNMEMEVNAFRYLNDVVDLVDNRTVSHPCYQWFNESGAAHGVKSTFIPDVPDKCPMQPGLYSIKQVVIPRFREDWDPKMSRLIPRSLPKADKWRIDVKYFDADKQYLGFYRQEFILKPKN